jgi:hypothetical protein
LEAVRWALAAGNVAQRPSMVRQGHPAAAVAVTLDVAAGGELVLRRSLRAKGARLTTEASATLDGVEVSEDRAIGLLEQSWAADARFVSRTAFLTEDTSAGLIRWTTCKPPWPRSSPCWRSCRRGSRRRGPN